jgi:ClpP class serine protease
MARSGGVGSVGVITMHIDQSARLDSMGIKVTFIYAGEHKKDGNPYEALPDSVKDRIQDRIDRIYGEFVGLVANNRGMEEQAVRDTEALTFDASNAVEVGFADRIGDMQKELAALSLAATEMEQMSTKATTTPAAGNEGSNITQAQLDDAVATARADGHAEGMSAERTRITGILNSEEAKTRPAAARMAVNAGMSVEAAAESLKDMPEEKPQAAAPAEPAPKGNEATAPAPTPFASNMDGPDVGAHVTDPADDADASVDLLGSYAMITGRDPRQKAN